MTIEDLKRVQEIDTELLFYVDSVCKKHNIEYFLYYGTLLGCVRHGGPIPWDGDVDIAMTRDNYLRFVDIIKKEVDTNKYIVKIMGSGSPKYISETKIGKVGTIYCMPGTEGSDIMYNVQLDVFCLDYAKPLTSKQFIFRLKVWNVLRYLGLNKSEKILLKKMIDKSNHRFKFIYKFGLDILHFLRIFVGEKNIERIGYLLFVDETKKSHYYSVAGYQFVWSKKWYGICEKEYCGRNLPIPIGYDDILKTQYGDYMKYPPIDQRYDKHFEDFIFKENCSI